MAVIAGLDVCTKRRRLRPIHEAIYIIVELFCQSGAGHGFVPGYGFTRSSSGIGSIRAEHLPQTGPGAVQAGLDRADRIARNLMNLPEFISFDVVQEDHEALLVAEGGKRLVESHYVIQPLGIAHRIQVSGQRFQAPAGELILFDTDQTGPPDTPPMVDEVVVHDPAQPGSRLPYIKQIIEPREGLDQYILEEILRFRFRAGKSKAKTVKPVKMRPQQRVKACALVLLEGTHAGRV